MKTFFLVIGLCFSILKSYSQQELIENEWILHYIMVDGVTYDVPQPNPLPPCNPTGPNPGVTFWENPTGKYNINAIISFNYFFNLNPFDADANTFTILEGNGAVTLGECDCLCDIENLYFYIYSNNSIPSDRIFNYEISTTLGQKNLIVTSPEGNIAAYGNYALSSNDFNKNKVLVSPTIGTEFSLNRQEINDFDTLEVYSLNGKKIASIQVLDDRWDASALTEGMYFIIGKKDSASFTQKIMVKK